jgi:hypothetical protein
MSRLEEFIEGWTNKLIPPDELKDVINDVSEERMVICNDCPEISTKHKTLRPDVHCTVCSCTLSAKTRSLKSACPKGKWKAFIIKNEE